MSMLTLYLIALGIGGAMVVITLVLGGDADADADAGADGSLDADHAGDADHGFDFFGGWLPIASVRFWTFFAAGFGLAGTLLTALELAPGVVTAVGSVAVGYFCGWGVVSVMKRLGKEDVSSGLGAQDYVGAAGKVVLPIAKDRTGKVRLHMAGRVIELLADTEEEEEIAADEPIIIYAVKEDGRAVVSKSEKLPE